LEPFKALSLGAFAHFLRDADEYKRTGVVPVPAGKKSRAAKAPKAPEPPKTPKPKPKTKDDAEAIRSAVGRLQGLYDRFADKTLTQAIIEAAVEEINKEFDADGLKAVARQFGISSGLTSKKAAKSKIVNRIVERKDRHERSEAFSASSKPAATTPEPAPTAKEEADSSDELVEEVEEGLS
jgi:hypothetical protein